LNSTSGLHRLSHRPAHLSNRPSTCAACRPSSPAVRTQLRLSSVLASPAHPYRSTFGLRRCPTLWPRLRTQPPALAGCCISVSTFQSTFDLRRRSTVQPCLRTRTPTDYVVISYENARNPRGSWRFILSDLVIQSALCLRLILPTDLRLSSLIDFSVVPSNSTSGFHRLLRRFGSSFHPAFDLRRLPTFRPCLSNSTSDSHRLSFFSGSTFPSTVGLRLCPTVQPAPLNSTSGLHRLSHRPAHPFTRPSTCVVCRPSGPAFRTQPPTLIGRCISGSSFQSTFGLHRQSTFWLRLQTRPPALTGCRVSGSAFPSTFDLRLRPTVQPCL